MSKRKRWPSYEEIRDSIGDVEINYLGIAVRFMAELSRAFVVAANQLQPLRTYQMLTLKLRRSAQEMDRIVYSQRKISYDEGPVVRAGVLVCELSALREVAEVLELCPALARYTPDFRDEAWQKLAIPFSVDGFPVIQVKALGDEAFRESIGRNRPRGGFVHAGPIGEELPSSVKGTLH